MKETKLSKNAKELRSIAASLRGVSPQMARRIGIISKACESEEKRLTLAHDFATAMWFGTLKQYYELYQYFAGMRGGMQQGGTTDKTATVYSLNTGNERIQPQQTD